ncbi:MAG: bifunctional riboflavin kinase/FAD synthetase [Rhodobacteraceae bacterium]|nr:bifunctional riboflavin kinase/FAD synthetase [Paracoccaceae bacterium]
MEIVRGYAHTSERWRGSVAAIGNFDGVHAGHQAVIRTAVAAARKQAAPAAVITFEPHPRQFFAPRIEAFRLTVPATKAHRLEQLGVQVVFELNFDRDFSRLEASDFAAQVLARGLGVTQVMVGEDFRYGYRRLGTPATLADDGKRFDFRVAVMPMVSNDEIEVSSTVIRSALVEGRPEDAARMLGCWHQLRGVVARGEGRGRKLLSMPTANLDLGQQQHPKQGVYAALVEIHDGEHAGNYRGAASLGTRPTFGDNPPNLEVHLFEFDGNIYGCDISVSLVKYLRCERAFDSVDELQAQMQRDCEHARLTLDRMQDFPRLDS